MEGQGLVLRALELAAVLALPIVAANLVAGVLAGVLQAITGWQDAALSQVPRLIIIVLVLIPLWPWMAGEIVEFAQLAWAPANWAPTP